MEQHSVLKLTDQLVAGLSAKFASADYQASIKSIKEATDTGTFEIVVSTDDTDRHGEIVDQAGLDKSAYMTNPVVLWGHNHSEMPVGITDEVYTRNLGTQMQTVARGRFAPHEFAQTLRSLYEAGMLKTASIGFIPKEYDGNRITKAELLEWSFVSIPANPYALALGKSGFSIPELLAKGILVEVSKTGDDVDNNGIDNEPGDTTEEVTAPVQEDEKVEEVAEVTEGDVADDVAEEVAEVEEKGAIAEQVADEEARQLKWANFKELDKLYWAFCSVYFADETPVDDFASLKAEFVQLISGESVESRLNNEYDIEVVKALDVFVAKAGRVLSASNRTKVENAISALEEVIAADSKEDKAHAPEREPSVDDAEGVIKGRKAMQELSTALSNVLHQMKEDAKANGQRVRSKSWGK